MKYVNLMEKTGFVVHFFPPTLFNEKFKTCEAVGSFIVTIYLHLDATVNTLLPFLVFLLNRLTYCKHLLLKNKFVIDINLEKKISVLHGKLVSLTPNRK